MFDQKTQDMICKAALIIAAIGAINWYLSTMDYNLVNKFLGDNKNTKITTTTDLEKFAYLLVGLSGVVLLWCAFFSDAAKATKRSNYMGVPYTNL
jgi:uncharacterized membrane protein YuzA (DUF378 family)